MLIKQSNYSDSFITSLFIYDKGGAQHRRHVLCQPRRVRAVRREAAAAWGAEGRARRQQAGAPQDRGAAEGLPPARRQPGHLLLQGGRVPGRRDQLAQGRPASDRLAAPCHQVHWSF